MVLVLPSLGFVPLWQLALPPGSYCTFHSLGLCKGRTFRTVPWSVARGVLGVGLALGWGALVQDLPGSSFGSSSPSLPSCRIPSTWYRLLSAPFQALPPRHLPGSAGVRFLRLREGAFCPPLSRVALTWGLWRCWPPWTRRGCRSW